MTQSQLEDAVACATGESARTVQARGFGPAGRRAALEPEDLALYAACPRCGSAAAPAGPTPPRPPRLRRVPPLRPGLRLPRRGGLRRRPGRGLSPPTAARPGGVDPRESSAPTVIRG